MSKPDAGQAVCRVCSMRNESIVAFWFKICTILEDVAMLKSSSLSEEEAVARQLREKLQRLQEDGAEWLQGAVADVRRDELRAMAKAAGWPVKSNSKWLTVSELQEALLAYLASEAGKVEVVWLQDVCNWDEVLYLLYNMFSNCKDNGLFQIIIVG